MFPYHVNIIYPIDFILRIIFKEIVFNFHYYAIVENLFLCKGRPVFLYLILHLRFHENKVIH